MSENRSLEGTIRDSGPDGEPGAESPRINLSVLTVSHERFRIIKTYAQGGLGVVSLAHDIELDRTVAVKEMRIGRPSDDDIQRFLLEARLTGQLDHPGIPPVYALGYFEDGRPFYAMRLVDGVTLRAAIKEFHGKYPPPDMSRQRSMQLRQLLGAIVSVCNTLRFAHSKGVLHRDIKPSNIMLGEYGETLLMDWGLAKSQKQSTPYSEVEAKAHQQRKRLEDPEDTGTGSVMGTPHYMSPEQAVGDVESINQRSEVYSVGATLYSVLTGKPPFNGHTRDEILAKVRRGEFLPPRAVDARVPPELNAICLKAMALERGDRYAGPGELATDIEHWLADESVSCYREPFSRRCQRWIKAHQVWVAGLAVLLVTLFMGLMIGAFIVSQQHTEAVAAKEEAAAATANADKVTEESRDLLSRTFITTFNSRIRNIPGTERTRLEILELFIKQFETWSETHPESFRDRHELAHAIYERSVIYNELNHVDLAWADMQRALRLLDDVLQSPDRMVVNPGLLDRIQLQTDMARLLREFPESANASESLAQQAFHSILRETDRIADTAVRQFELAEASQTLGLAKAVRGQFNEAFELISEANSIYLKLANPQRKNDVDQQIFDGSLLLRFKTLRCQFELGKVAQRLGDLEFALQQFDQVELAIDQMQTSAPMEFAWSLLRIENSLAKSTCNNEDLRSHAFELRHIIVLIEKELKLRPSHRGLVELLVTANNQLVECDLYCCQLPEAREAALSAWRAAQQLKELGVKTFKHLRIAEDAERQLRMIVQCQGDGTLLSDAGLIENYAYEIDR